MFGLRQPTPVVEHEFEIGVSSDGRSVLVDIEWQHKGQPDRLVLTLSRSETRELISCLEEHLKPRDAAA